MKRKTVSVLLSLIMVVCALTAITQKASAGPTVQIEVTFYAGSVNGQSGHMNTATGDATRTVTVTKNSYATEINNNKAYCLNQVFDGWYSDPTGGVKVTGSNGYYTKVYARYRSVAVAVSGKFIQAKFYNEVQNTDSSTPNKVSLYNRGYAALFRKNANSVTWCTDSAAMDLLNRRLAKESRLSGYYFFDIRDAVKGMAYSGTGNFNTSSITKSTGIYSNVNLGSFNNGGEICNTTGSRQFTNTLGCLSGTPRTYTMTFENVTGSPANRKTKLINLLIGHPEGIWVYFHAANGGNDHALLIIEYLPATDEFRYIDNGSSAAGPILYSSTCLPNKGYGSGKANNLVNYIFRVGYIR